MEPRAIGRYRVERELGRGGMAVVHLAHQRDLERPVALKELAGLAATDATAAIRFLREARLVGSLNHPNIVSVIEYFEHGGIPYIAMEYLPRGPLRRLVGTLTDAQSACVLADILAGLSYAADRGIVHRDLKPENLMRTDSGSTKIADFGIASAYDELANANLTPVGEFVGAPGYVSPEQVLGEKATTASDLYSVGVLAFELLSGAVPFAPAGSGGKLLVLKVNERAPSLATVRPELDRRLVAWVDRLLERDPEQRWQTASAAREELEDRADAALPRWRRDGLLPADDPPRRPVPRAAAASRFVSTKTLRTLSVSSRLAVNALTRPLNLAVPAALVLAALVLHAWLAAVAIVAYASLAAISFFDEAEAHRVVRK